MRNIDKYGLIVAIIIWSVWCLSCTRNNPQEILMEAQFRGTHIPADHPVLVGKTLVPIDPQPEVFTPPPPPESQS